MGIETDQIRVLRFAPRDHAGADLPVEVLDRSELLDRFAASWFDRPERLTFHLLLILGPAAGAHEVDLARLELPARSVLVLRPGQVHRFDTGRRFPARLILIPPATAAVTRAERCFGAGGSALLLSASPAEATALEVLVEQLAADRGPGRGVPLALLDAVLARVERLAAEQSPATTHDPRFAALAALVDENYARHRDVAWYAATLGYSSQTLSRIARDRAGVGAKALIDRRVVLEARRLLAGTDDLVETIGAQLGFTQTTNFVRHFQRHVGQSPSAFRRRHRLGRAVTAVRTGSDDDLSPGADEQD